MKLRTASTGTVSAEVVTNLMQCMSPFIALGEHRQYAECPLCAMNRGCRQGMHTRVVFTQQLDQPQFQIGPIGVRVQQGPKLPPL